MIPKWKLSLTFLLLQEFYSCSSEYQSSILFYWASQHDSATLRRTIIFTFPFINISLCVVEN